MDNANFFNNNRLNYRARVVLSFTISLINNACVKKLNKNLLMLI